MPANATVVTRWTMPRPPLEVRVAKRPRNAGTFRELPLVAAATNDAVPARQMPTMKRAGSAYQCPRLGRWPATIGNPLNLLAVKIMPDQSPRLMASTPCREPAHCAHGVRRVQGDFVPEPRPSYGAILACGFSRSLGDGPARFAGRLFSPSSVGRAAAVAPSAIRSGSLAICR